MKGKLKYFIGTLDVILGLLVMVALINWGTVFWFKFNIVEWMSFGMIWIQGTIYTIVSVLGSIWLSSSIVRLLFK